MKLNVSLPFDEIRKRDGRRVPFDASKIRIAITKAGEATEEYDQNEAELLTAQAIKVLTHRQRTGVPEIEQIQDIVEQVLISSNYIKTARAYIIYREQHKKLRTDKKTFVDVTTSVNEYLDRLDWRINANANQGYSLGGLILNVSGKMIANYWLNHVFSPEIGQAHRNADLHIHDLDMLSGYCAGWSLKALLEEGFNGVPGKVEASPPKHLSSAVGQMVNFLGTLQNEWAGAQAFSSFDTYLAPFVRTDNMKYDEVHQHIQEFVYNLNVPSRWGTQTPFTNVTLDWICPEDLRWQKPRIAGIEQDFTFGELQVEMDMINRAFIDVMSRGDAKGRVFTFPIPTYNITDDFPWDHPNTIPLFEMTAKYGIPYFQNFVNSDLSPNMVRSMCCRLQLDLRELLKRGNGLFGSAEMTGSIGVITINCARIGYIAKGDKNALYSRIEKLLNYAKEALITKRKIIQRLIDGGLFPYTKRYLKSLKNHFSTIGVNGINECIRNFTDGAFDITDERGHAFACEMLDFIRNKITEFQEETGSLFNLEATPAEGTTYRFAKEDKQRYPDILQAGTEDAPYYTNSSQVPSYFVDDPYEALSHQEELQRKYTGGTVFHLYMGERISDAEACKKLVKRTLEKFRIPYITVTPVFSICPKHGYINGNIKYCPTCDDEMILKKYTEVEIQEQ
ncbi:ribonucleoside triphosphate reductase [Candidatus Latescibacterota bacterium]